MEMKTFNVTNFFCFFMLFFFREPTKLRRALVNPFFFSFGIRVAAFGDPVYKCSVDDIKQFVFV